MSDDAKKLNLVDALFWLAAVVIVFTVTSLWQSHVYHKNMAKLDARISALEAPAVAPAAVKEEAPVVAPAPVKAEAAPAVAPVKVEAPAVPVKAEAAPKKATTTPRP